LVGFTSDKLRPLTGKTLAEVARERGTSPEETAMDLVVEDGSRIETIFFIMSEDNVRRLTGLPWMSFDSDEASQAPEGVFLTAQPHPRAYGSFARLLGKYVREDKASTLQDAIRRLTAFPASNLKIKKRGHLEKDFFADVVVFDPDTIIDLATYKDPQQYAVGVHDVFVNGVQVLKDGDATGATPGRFVHGPGWDGRTSSLPH